MHPSVTRMALMLSALGVLAATRAAQAQYPAARSSPPAVTLGAPRPADVPAVPLPPDSQAAPSRAVRVPPLPADTPPIPFLGARYSFYGQRTPCQGFGYYAPGYTAPTFYNPRYRDPGPYFYDPTYPYVPSYYSYYYTPGFFRY